MKPPPRTGQDCPIHTKAALFPVPTAFGLLEQLADQIFRQYQHGGTVWYLSGRVRARRIGIQGLVWRYLSSALLWWRLWRFGIVPERQPH